MNATREQVEAHHARRIKLNEQLFRFQVEYNDGAFPYDTLQVLIPLAAIPIGEGQYFDFYERMYPTPEQTKRFMVFVSRKPIQVRSVLNEEGWTFTAEPLSHDVAKHYDSGMRA